MQQQRVRDVDLKGLQAGLDRGQELRLVEIGDVHLGGDAEILAGKPGGLERGAGLGFVAVHLRGVESAVADLGRRLNGIVQLLAIQWKRAEAALVCLLEIDRHDLSSWDAAA